MVNKKHKKCTEGINDYIPVADCLFKDLFHSNANNGVTARYCLFGALLNVKKVLKPFLAENL